MAKKMPLPPGFDDLSVDDQINYVQSLWNRIAARPNQIAVPDWHRQVLDERIAAHEADPSGGRPWEEVRNQVRSKLDRRKPRRG